MIIMGRGDKRSRRGKIWRGTSGKTRPWKKKKGGPPQPNEGTKKFKGVIDQVSTGKEKA